MTRLLGLFGIVVVLLSSLTMTRAQAAPSSELIQVGATGVFLVDGIPVTANLSAFQSTTFDAQGRITRRILAGNVTMFGRLPEGELSLNVTVTNVRYEGEWAILQFPFSINGSVRTGEIHVKARSSQSLGQIRGQVIGQRDRGAMVEDLFRPGRVSREMTAFTFTNSGVTITYRRF